MFNCPDQVDADSLRNVFDTGVFRNNANYAFQEGYYPQSAEVTALFTRHGFNQTLLRSIRGWGYGREEQIYKLKDENPAAFGAVIGLINKTAGDPAIVETCSHAVYVGRKIFII